MNRLPQELFKRLREIQVITEHLAQDFLAGTYRSAFKGRGMEFEEVREYIPGDEIRHIDWNVTARMNQPYVKNFREEREMTVMLVVDISSSTYFGTKQELKKELIAELGALIAFSAIKNQDKVGLILFSDQVDEYLPPKKGTRHVLRVIRELLMPSQVAKKGSNIANALEFLGKVQNKSVITFLISDFLSEDFSKQYRLLAQKQDLIAIRVFDPAEENIFSIPLVHMQDLESGQTLVLDTTQAALKTHFREAVHARVNGYKNMAFAAGSSWLDMETGASPLKTLKAFFKRRSKKR